MSVQFGSDFFSGNRERLRQLFTGTAPIILTANGLLQKGSDEAYRFYQDRSFWYLTGIDEPDVILVMDKGKEYLIVPTRELVKETFDGAVEAEKLSSISGIKDVFNEKEGWKQLEARIKKVQHVATLAAPPKYVTFWGMYTNPARTELLERIREINSTLEFLDLRQHLSRMRMVKQPIEIEAIRESVDITVSTLKEVCRPNKLSRY
jgi:Xaa-Pro aminopeptidase